MDRQKNLSRKGSALERSKNTEKNRQENEQDLLKSMDKSNKSKASSLNDKVGKANIKDWKDQKLLPTGFFEYMKTCYQNPSFIKETYGKFSDLPHEFPGFVSTLEDGDLTINTLTPSVRAHVDEFGMGVQEQYLKYGLSEDEVKLRREIHGPNKLPEKKKTPEIIKYLAEITNLFSILLWIAGILSFIGFALTPYDKSNLWLAVVIVAIILVTGTFSWYQNSQSEKIMDSFKSFGISQVNVIREGKPMKISAIDLVIGDVIKVNIGEKVPADIRIFTANDLQVDNSPLTGESIPVKISAACGEKGRENPLESTNLLFFSTLCKNGSGTGVVIKTGINTFMGRIADLASSAGIEMTSLQREINDFIKLIAIIAVSIGVGFFILGIIINYPLITDFLFAIGIVVANVPEGLLAVVTISLAITAKKMLKRKVMVKNLQSVETLGSITVICSDKTGTLTQNKMSVVHLWYDRQLKKVKEDQMDVIIDNEQISMKTYNPFDLSFPIVKFAAVCGSKGKFIEETPDDFDSVVQGRNKFLNRFPNAPYEKIMEEIARLKKLYQPQYKIEYDKNIDGRLTDSDASETGILKFFENVEKIEIIREKYPQHIDKYSKKEVLIPFNSSLKFTCFLRKICDNARNEFSGYQLAIKGAPERIITRCNRYLLNGKEFPIDDSFHKDFAKANKCFALKGERVIGMAYTKLDTSRYYEDFKFFNHPQELDNPDFKYDVPQPNYPINDLCFVGLVAMEDPPREGVKDAIEKCHAAGIKVIMVTGDQPLTAASIAYQIGIIKDLDDTPEIIMEREGLKTIEEAEKKSNTIIITGDRLHNCLKDEESLSEDNPKKGQFLRNWLLKKDVVFARTSPEQKLIIVDGCQKLSHVVAVTGDGVNDSPAIKKADIGIAMGKVGTDVAKDAADILLLDDNFSNIVRGIKEGRRIFDTLKKIIGYNLTSNVTELLPFLGFVILQFPLPFTTIMVLIIDIGTDVYPDIAFSYEPAESGVMNRRPRNSKTERLCSIKLFTWGYLFTGVIECSAGFLMYFAAFNFYGFYPSSLFFIVQENGIAPSRNDIHNPYDSAFRGNSNAFLSTYSYQLGFYGESQKVFQNSVFRNLDYTSDMDTWIDFRLFKYEWSPMFFGKCRFDSIGVGYDGPVCFHMIEALRHAQSAFLLGVIIMQIANGTMFRTISTSIFEYQFSNNSLNIAYFVQVGLLSICLYVPGFNTGLQLRGLLFENWIPCLGVFITMILWTEITKYLIRNVKNPDGTPGFFHKFFSY